MMPTSRAPRTVQRSLAWLIWLALLLPTAQAAALCHGLSHLSVDARADPGSKQAPHAGHCDLCVVSATVCGGALAAATPLLPCPAARHELPHEAARADVPALRTLAYLSRAPPVAPR